MKPLKGDSFEVEADPATKVEELKKSVAAAAAEFPAEQQKLIYSGRILKDDELVQDIGIKPGQFVVVMAAKARPPSSSTSGTAAPPSQPAAVPSVAQEAPTAPTVATPDPAAAAEAHVVTDAGMEATITQLCDMGFPRPEVERCLRAAFNNPDRAVEYLTGGIPGGLMPSLGVPATPQATAAAAPTPTAPAPLAAAGRGAAFPAMSGGGTPSPLHPTLAGLRNSPQFGQLAGLVAQNPQMLARVLPALAQSNPEIVQAIQSNPDAFMQMLQETAAAGGGAGGAGGAGGRRAPAQDPVAAMLAAGGGNEEGSADLQQMAGALAQNPQMLEHILPQLQQSDPELAAAIQENPQAFLQMLQEAGAGDFGEPGGGGGGDAGLAPGGATVIQLGEEESAAVDRLVALGFDRQTAAQAYLACDKSEELAANFLFEHGGDADMD
eukprot:CAMPEP_0171103812 /NCGR_PEP_ID=MMETSP0766_2-20121228/59430_1 /TAXON_ID=439317 /ORGANISM="Gambierdiscus australes, Strain CAWD 149" /LENGTH=436 /DNA_ID=CAMNT_0011564311 /DNA_START=88 /DNA_END=1398 /DNA_ORIENTATION=-